MCDVYKTFIQTIYNLVTEALEKQVKPAVTPEGRCKYRIEGTDLKCAVGHLIPDANYHAELESVAPSGLIERGVHIFPPHMQIIFDSSLTEMERRDVVYFLDTLQLAHDMSIYELHAGDNFYVNFLHELNVKHILRNSKFSFLVTK